MRHRPISTYVVVILFIVSNPIYSDVFEDSTININDNNSFHRITEEWFFNINDDISNLIDSNNYEGWYRTVATGAWQVLVPEAKNYYNAGWYKLPINISKSVKSKKIGLIVPLCYGKVEVYFNQTLIHDSETESVSKPIIIEIPNSIINLDSNTLSLRVKSFSGWGGFGNFFYIGTYEEVHTKWLGYVIKNTSIAFISFFLSIFFLLHYFYRKKEKYNFLFSLLCISVSLFVMGYNGLWLYLFNYSWAYWVLTFIGGIGMYLMPILFVNSFYHLKIKLFGKIFTFFYYFLLLFVVIEFLFTKQIFHFNRYLYIFFNLSYIFIVFYLVLLSIRAIRKELLYSKMMIVGVTLLVLSFVYSMLVFAAIIFQEPLIGEGFFAMVVVFSIVLAKRFAQTHSDLELSHALNLELNRTLERKVEYRTKELKRKNREVMESIEYAALIQNSILPSNDILTESLSDFFVCWKPKGIVGGDFYWFYKKGDDFLIAIVDCTGHGVPGALLTMTATSVLERVVAHINSNDPGKILSEINIILKGILKREDTDYVTDDGLDIGLCHYNSNEQLLTYAGSRIRLHVVEDGYLREIKGDSQGIGYERSKEDYEYTNHTIKVTKDLSFYMTTDGYLDQSGGDFEFGFGWSKYKRLLVENHRDKMEVQIEKLEDALQKYQKDCEQRDDITLLGFKVKIDE